MARDQSREMTLLAMIERLPELVNNDPVLMRRGRYLVTNLMIEVGDRQYEIAIDHGRVTAIRHGPLIMSSWSFAVRGDEAIWQAFWQPFPAPHFHDIFALAKHGALRIEGDHRHLMTNLLYFKGLLAAPRVLHSQTH